MPIPAGWEPDAAIRQCKRSKWQGEAWRIHRNRYSADDPGGSLKVSGRYHRGGDLFPEEQIWAALYLALSPEIALAELVRHVTPDLLPFLNDYRLSRLELHLDDVLDLRALEHPDVSIDDLRSDIDHDVTRSLGRAAYDSGAEAILIPSATRLGDNLIVCPENLLGTSSINVLDHRHPRLYVDRST